METILLHAHRGFAYLILLALTLFIVALLSVMFSSSGKITKWLRKSTLFTMIFFHLQFVIGLVVLLTTSSFMSILNASGMGSIMQNPELRYTFIEHPFSMLTAAVLLTIANKKIKQNETMNFGILTWIALALALFFYAIPFAKLFQAS